MKANFLGTGASVGVPADPAPYPRIHRIIPNTIEVTHADAGRWLSEGIEVAYDGAEVGGW